MSTGRLCMALALCLMLVGAVPTAAQGSDPIVLVSVNSLGVQGNGHSSYPVLSADGRFVAFVSTATLVAADTNSVSDVYVHDRLTGLTTRVSVASDGTQGNNISLTAAISGDGDLVAFSSLATNLVAGDTNNQRDIYVRDRTMGETTRISVDSDGTQANGYSYVPAISGDGRLVAFDSSASNLVEGDTNGKRDAFVHDRVTGETTRISVDSDGAQGDSHSTVPAISTDGRLVAFDSSASNLVAGDTNGKIDVFVHDVERHRTTRVSVATGGEQANGGSGNAALSTNGRFVVFDSDASNLVEGDTNGQRDVFVRDRVLAKTTRISVNADGDQGDLGSGNPVISDDGRLVAFLSLATNLVGGDTNDLADIFIHDRVTGITARVSVAADGAQSDGTPSSPTISADGHTVAFASEATNLVDGDDNGVADVFVYTVTPLTGVTLTGPEVAPLGASQTYTASIAPQNATAPLRYTWTPSPASGQGTPVATYAWDSSGPVTVTVRVQGIGGDVTDSQSVQAMKRIEGVTLTGATEVAAEATATFEATVAPSDASGPFTYTWTPTPASGQGTASVDYSWPLPGPQTITVTVSNGVSAATATRSVAVLAGTLAPVDPGTGGTLVDPAAGVNVTAPVGAVTDAVTLVYTPRGVPDTAPVGHAFGGRAFTLEAYRNGVPLPGLVFQQPVALTLTYTDAGVASVDEATLRLFTWYGGAWVDAATTCNPASDYVRELEANRLRVAICHLSEYALFGGPPQPADLPVYLPMIR